MRGRLFGFLNTITNATIPLGMAVFGLLINFLKSQWQVTGAVPSTILVIICTYRQMGIPLKEIQQLLKLAGNTISDILEKHLMRLSAEIRTLRKQQFAIVNLLKNQNVIKQSGLMDKSTWVELLRASGLDDADMDRWHQEFEKMSPRAHHDFLVSLGIDETEIAAIRKAAAKPGA